MAIRPDIIERLRAKYTKQKQQKISFQEADALFGMVVESIEELLCETDKVLIKNFGTFSITRRKSRIWQNPRSGIVKEFAERKSVKFISGKPLRRKLNPNYSAKEILP